MKKTIKLLKNDNFESSSQTTEQFKSFYRVFRNEFISVLKAVGADKWNFNMGHFYISGFFGIGDRSFYFSLSDVRYFNELKLLIRTAKDFKDFTGGSNNYVNLDNDIINNIKSFVERS